ncbi:hypothetical protein Zmor_010080 [Zophobas morio]|uniref:Uncharacterized protein n=1 Tax=Zophobas morio TaxID=2755281 RepID=A0AA38IJZ5_9CUCU|nr:hypothetical protein Zmor_010080 [Zophobas morio]
MTSRPFYCYPVSQWRSAAASAPASTSLRGPLVRLRWLRCHLCVHGRARACAGRVGCPTPRVDHQYSRNARADYITVVCVIRGSQFRLVLQVNSTGTDRVGACTMGANLALARPL